MRLTFAPLAVLAATLFISGCVSPPAPPRPAPEPVAPPRSTPPVSPKPQGADWRDWAVTPGDWAYRADTRGSTAVFGAARGDALLTLHCDRTAGMVYLSRSGAVAAPLTLRTSSLERTVPVQPSGASVSATLTARDPLLDAMAFSRGRFIVEQPGATTLVVPAWAEVARVIEDCRG
ncbi:hypothetical protein [Sphingomonas psychrolutea]|uniref:Lipoprotein n=1 Tax=Sphingomonas psychrolutea TaxID=1259676 RepID=A0ABQ1G1E0_9SPHN|nr:hypothetical protein [Sphingomonas psychrolutea]GGA34754.1 hypothetical protein GCM10011395_01390 [Sphingomonas psychrolutea]